MIDNKNFECSFCQRPRKQVKRLIASKSNSGQLSLICDICTRVCFDVIKKDSCDNIKSLNLLSPKQIVQELDLVVQGQAGAKKMLAVAVYNHYKRTQLNVNSKIQIEKSNLLLLGPSGCGKTLLVSTLSKLLQVPFISVDATTFTEVGYVGDDVEVCVTRLLQAAEGNVEKAKYGIIFIDEIDKIRRSESNGNTKDVSGEGVQQSLLKLVEGCVVNVPLGGNKKNPQADLVAIDTSNMLFIFGGAFPGIANIVTRRINKGATLTIADNIQRRSENEYNLLLSDLSPEDIVKYGFIQEFVGRIQVIIPLKELSEQDLIAILCNGNQAILKQYQYFFTSHKCDLIVTDEAIATIAKEAMRQKTGARGLRTILNEKLFDVMYNLPNITTPSVVVLDDKTILGKEKLEIVPKTSEEPTVASSN